MILLVLLKKHILIINKNTEMKTLIQIKENIEVKNKPDDLE